MAEKYCNQTLEGLLQLARYRETFFFSPCVSHFAFSLVTSLGNILVIRAFFKASSIPANEKKLFLSLAFSDLGTWGTIGVAANGRHYAAILNELQVIVTFLIAGVDCITYLFSLFTLILTVVVYW